MDELVVLDLLLYCPVCLGKLDATAKVLPCQHTFCQPCLQRLLKAKKELQCPECRTHVFCNIDELPANLLLVRLLDGIRGRQSIARRNSFQRMGGLVAQESFKRSQEPKTNHDSPQRLFSKARMPVEEIPSVKTLSTHRGRLPSDLSFHKGDIIVLRRQLEENWHHGDVKGDMKVLRKMEHTPALCKALYNFELKENDWGKNKDCLKFVKDDVISVIRRVDDNWAEGKIGDQVGLFPLLFVELNHTAKQLLESNKPKGNNLRTPTQLKKSSSKAKNSESATIRRMPEARRKSPRQYLITNALNTFNKMVRSPVDRQTPEISTPILISSSNPTVIEKAEPLSSSPVKVNASIYYTTFGAQGTGSSLVAVPNSQQTILANMCVALHPYIARRPEEMDIQKGEGLRVLGKFEEGWLRGVSLMTGKIGIFPSHCVYPVYRKSSSSSDPQHHSYPTKWVSSNASVSSQGSVSENGNSKPARTFFVPSTSTDPFKNITATSSAMISVPLRRGNNSIMKSSPSQKTVQNNSVAVAKTNSTRSPTTTIQPHQIPNNIAQPGVFGNAEPWSRQYIHYDTSLVGRGVDYRRYSTTSSVFLEPAAKPSTSAPSSILVKPDTPKASSEKQVKTVRFLNFSPPPLKRQSAVFQPDGKSDHVVPVSPQKDASPTIETVVYSPARAGSSLVPEARKVSKIRSMSNDLTPSAQPALSSPSKRTTTDYTKRWSVIYHTQDVLSS
ncbi:E3 ubiquitin-protein ligase SH3RF2 [Spea bombifrons]|uniref:E3 ubiquitin-protein ligase SH3RF2 n=1 Tax=Spea bombifrons TaxID=233779 RepID=UPI0023499E3E|nr:E3 ubiquitin-protein ligase SH3RF2 [Spea bombifrons]